MSNINWTTEQRLAIRTVDADILLSASAGSGKTAVLAQRCVHLLSREDSPCDIDELLVLTFTESAAAEMRSRIAEKLRRLCKNTPPGSRLHRQLALLDQSYISTVHSFCNRILREFFYLVGLDGTFEILDSNDAELLKTQIAGELFEDHYALLEDQAPKSAKAFPKLIRSYGSNAGDRPLIDLIVKLNNFLDTLSEHDAHRNDQNLISGDRSRIKIANLDVVKRQNRLLLSQLDGVISRLEHAGQMIKHYPHLGFYNDYIQGKLLCTLKDVRDTLANGNFASALTLLEQLDRWPSAPKRTKGLSDAEIAPIKSIIDSAKKDFKNTQKKYALAAKDVIRQLESTEPFENLLARLHGEFGSRYKQTKHRQNTLDFADLEHLSLRLLLTKDGTTDVAKQLQRRFRYILVDEYQDISPVQEAIIQCVSNAGKLFMVGDVKQSIYSFRSAEPDIFLDKFNTFTPVSHDSRSDEDLNRKRIDLNNNFRSRRGVINGINYIFSRCMTSRFSGVDYYRDGQLIYAATLYDAANDDTDNSPPVEIHLLQRSRSDTTDDTNTTEPGPTVPDAAELDATRGEAFIAARRIRQMVGLDQPDGRAEFDVVDPHSGKTRPVRYRDIVILLRSMQNRADTWSEVLGQMGIPVYAQLSSGYFVATEIQDMISLLKLLDNPIQDIPLASVLRGPIVGLNESQLADIRLHNRKSPYYDALHGYSQDGPDTDLRSKLSEFLRRLDNWRSIARKSGLAELIWTIYRDTNLPACVLALPDGHRRHCNLLYLHDCARRFDSFARRGLARFLSFVKKLRDEQGDFAPAPLLSEADNVVRIMTVHKSKGLEFPVVIAADLSGEFNLSDTKRSVLFESPRSTSRQCSFGLRVVDAMSRDRWPTVAHNVVADELKQRRLAEEMRILYVAFTRARERLILIAGIDSAKRQNQWQSWQFYRSPLPEFLLRSARCPMDWLGPALAAHPDMQSFFEEQPTVTSRQTPGNSRFALEHYSDIRLKEMLEKVDFAPDQPESPTSLDAFASTAPSAELSPQAQQIIDRIRWRYPHQPLPQLRARCSVTDLKHQLDLERNPDFSPDLSLLDWQVAAADKSESAVKPSVYAELSTTAEPFRRRPKFTVDHPLPPTAADKGTWTHLFLQKLDLNGPVDEPGLREQLRKITERGFLTDHQAGDIDIDSVVKFFSSELGRQMIDHRQNVRREWPFTLAIPAEEVYREMLSQKTISQSRPSDLNEPVLLRGAIDCLFETDSGLVIIDYKTDNISAGQSSGRTQSYHVQMRIYRLAVETILTRPIAGTYLYFLTPSVTVQIQ